MIQLWDVQEQMIADIRAAYRAKHRKVLLVSPTGSGKTVMFSYMTHNHVQKGGRVLILVHRRELIKQVCETLETFDQWHSVIAPRHFYDSSAPVQVASVFSLVRRLDSLRWVPTLIIVDEAHHAVDSTTWGKILSRFDCHVLGVTATPTRSSGEGLGESFEVMVLGPGPQELIDRGYLSPFRVFCPSAQNVPRRKGETESAWLGRVQRDLLRPKIIGDAVAHYERLARGKQAVAFALSVEDAHEIARRFRDAGHSAAALDGDMPDTYRDEMVRDFKARRLRVLTSCDLISEGFDCPGIEVGISLRVTDSLGLWLQQMGRCLRTAPGKKEAILLDHAGNALKHGLPTEPREWTLEGCKSSRQGEKAPSVRVCPNCWAAMGAHHRVCIQCKVPFEVAPRQVPRKEGDLAEMTADQIAALRYKETQQDKQSLDVLISLGRRRGYKNPEGWAKHVLDGQKSKRARKAKGVPDAETSTTP